MNDLQFKLKKQTKIQNQIGNAHQKIKLKFIHIKNSNIKIQKTAII